MASLTAAPRHVAAAQIAPAGSGTPQFFGRRVGGVWPHDFESVSGLRHPSDATRRHAGHERKVRYIARNDGAGADKRMPPDGHATHDGGVGPDARPTPHQRALILVLARHRATWIDDVGEHHGRSAEDIVFQLDALVQRHIVLDAGVVAHRHAVHDDDVLPQ
jgi:hypothetical protein